MKHTQEPWKVVMGERGYNIANAAGKLICFDILDESQNGSVDADRIVECVNALEGIDNPVKMRQTWDVVKELELDSFYKLKEYHESMMDKLKALFFDFCPMTPQQQQIQQKLNRILDNN